MLTVHVVKVRAFEIGRSTLKAWPPGINTRMLGGTWYLAGFHDTVWVEHADGMGGLSEKNELIDEESVETQLESDESPTV